MSHAFKCLSGLAIAGLMLFGPTQKANATIILVFGQNSSSNVVTGTANGAGTSTTIGVAGAQITITSYLPGGTPIVAFLNLTATSSGAATMVGTDIRQSFSGTFTITSNSNGTGTNYLSGSFNDAVFGSGTGLTMSASSATVGESVTFTSGLISALDLGDPRAIALSFTNVTPGASIFGTTLASFTSSISGNFSAATAAVPEPATMVSALVGLSSLGLFRLGRRKPAVLA